MAWLAAVSGGCASVRVTDPVRTATEQFLLSGAAAEAVNQLSFDALSGRQVYVDTTFFAAAEQAFVLGELRARLLLDGVRVHANREEAEIVLEVRSGGVGIDRYDYLFGLPSMFIPAAMEAGGMPGGGTTVITPELAILKNIKQQGVASVAFVAYWADTGEVVHSSGPHVGRSLREDYWFLGWGPRTVGDIPTTEQTPAD